MRVSVITVAYNAADTIADTLASVAEQTHHDIEHIVVDGASSDSTMDVVRRFGHVTRCLSEPDRGIYDAMNKGLALATGDVVGFLNADDAFARPDILERVSSLMAEEKVDLCFADVVYQRDGRVLRRYSSARFRPSRLRFGWEPAHPTCYVRSDFFERVGKFSLDYRISADYEWMLRAFLEFYASWRYVPEVWVRMKPGGVSTRGLQSWLLQNREIVRACRSHGIRTNLAIVLSKTPWKVMELWRK